MKRLLFFIVLLAVGIPALGQKPAKTASIVVDPAVAVGPIRDMHGVNNAPYGAMSKWYKAAKIPYMRPHDATHATTYGGDHTIDITGIFPDFSKDENDPASYDFHYSDETIARTLSAGTKILYRLGQSIEHGTKKYGAYPPADYEKWARICEHVIRHFNEGWANGHHWNIRYWEIWNEPDIDTPNDRWKTDPRMWGGPAEEFYKFYCIAAKHLKKCFPDLMIGGPAVTGSIEKQSQMDWLTGFFEAVAKEKAPMDFFSWHSYVHDPAQLLRRNHLIDSTMAAHGFADVESILDEWNYVIQWSETSPESARARFTEKAAALIAAFMITAQNETRISKLMFYDFRPSTTYNNVLDPVDGKPLRSYFPFLIWSKLAEYGTAVKVEVNEPNCYVTAARSPKGKLRIFVCRYTYDSNDVYSKELSLKVEGRKLEETTAFITDSHFLHTAYPVPADKNGRLRIYLEPRAFMMLEL